MNWGLKIVTHSMGGAYAKGLIEGMVTAGESNGKSRSEIIGLIDFELDLAPYQSDSQTAVCGVPTISISHTEDWDAGHKRIKNAGFLEYSLFPFINDIRSDWVPSSSGILGLHYFFPGYSAHGIKSFTKSQITEAIHKLKRKQHNSIILNN